MSNQKQQQKPLTIESLQKENQKLKEELEKTQKRSQFWHDRWYNYVADCSIWNMKQAEIKSLKRKVNVMRFLLVVVAVLFAFPTSAEDMEHAKFHFNDCVKVTAGFYKDCVGRVKELHFDTEYEVRLVCNHETAIRSINVTLLQLQDDTMCGSRQ